jgi:methyltransferase (TIGR00027 family)
MPIKHISDTARWVAYFRALESERADALFKDPFARRLAGSSGEEMAQQLGAVEAIARSMAVRTAVFDELITERVSAHGVNFILNLAAGLDSRPWRLRLPRPVRWVDVDLADMLDYKRSVLHPEKPLCDYQAMPADLTNDADCKQIIARLGAESGRGLVITEGLLVYLKPEQVAALARTLHGSESFRWWLTDIVAPRSLSLLQAIWEPVLAGGNVKFQFAPPESTEFFRSFGWSEEAFRSSLEEARRLGRQVPIPWLTRLLLWVGSPSRREEFRRLSGTVLMERA